ncbi:MAG: C-terminal binding protein, partial [Acidobacteria bacterium]
MAKFRVLIVDNRYPSYDEERAVLSRIDADILVEPSEQEDRLAAAAADVDGLIVNLAPITGNIIRSMRRCKCISRYGVGYDNIDVRAAREKGIHLANVPDYCSEDVSDQAMALFLDCVRKVSRKDRCVRAGQWNLTSLQRVYRIAGKTFGFVGYGLIARSLHRKLRGFNLGRILVFDPFVTADSAGSAKVELTDLDTLCRESDFISIHVPLRSSTREMIGERQFSLMKSGAILINTSRGAVIHEQALISALKSGRIACAGLDVFATEPL